ncbi:hypothetical protein DID88_004713 [Monilinia fructigena]|uniref:Uncharacterized protein n=1 Tax=Monilinia fructigena TaxID=38457 RepID=A0A395IRF5_9HELO|nr:hypothetical protein DID88_004713 [Monilinia fructigena]
MTDQDSFSGGENRTSKIYQTVLPELGRLLLSQHLPSVDGKEVTVDEFAATVEKATELIHSKKAFLQLQIVRPDYVQFLIDREAWEVFCGGPSQKGSPNYRPFPSKDPRIDDPLPQYFDPDSLTPDTYGLIYRDNLHPACPNCRCGVLCSRAGAEYVDRCPYSYGIVRVTTPQEEYAAFRERLEEQSRKLGYKNSDERWERECEIEEAREEERKKAAVKEGMEAKGAKTLIKQRGKKEKKHLLRCSNM